ncbi:MAG: carbon-nitrogen hydrolase family protein [Gammaproteobacteria bacterium]|nr:carbon-nitrogen hydrolase family protein [Gammaproteobacteria bacterium]
MRNRIAAVQMVSTADVQGNLQAAARLIANAAEQGAALVLLPENFAVLDGGPLRQFGEIQGDNDAPLQRFLAQQSSLHGITLIGGTIPLISRPSGNGEDQQNLLQGRRVRPSCLVYSAEGNVVSRYDKIHLFDVVVDDGQAEYFESGSFVAGDEVVTFDSPLGRLGLTVCYDLRFPELYRKLTEAGAEILTVPSAFTRTTGAAHWETLLRARAIENQCYVLAANQGGVHNEKRETYGHSMIIDPWGTVLDSVPVGEGVAVAEVDRDFLARIRRNMPIDTHRRL